MAVVGKFNGLTNQAIAASLTEYMTFEADE